MNVVLLDDQNYSSAAGGDGYVLIQAGACFLYGLTATNLTGTTVYVQVFDSLTHIAPGTAPKTQLQVNGNNQASLSKALPLYRWKFATGLYIACSTTAGSYTAVAGPATGSGPVMLNVFSGQ